MGLSENPIPLQGDLTRDLETLAAYAEDLDARLDNLISGTISLNVYTETNYGILKTAMESDPPSYPDPMVVYIIDASGATTQKIWNPYTGIFV